MFANHKGKNKRKAKVLTSFVHSATFYKCSFSHLDGSSSRWPTHLTNHAYFDYGKNLKTSVLSPMLGSKCCRFQDPSGICVGNGEITEIVQTSKRTYSVYTF